jgi:para-nitrobenzyl esterase
LAQKGAVVVTLNYRLGVFGFFAHPELTRESDHNASGNYGLMDQIAALKWVHSNIAAFGGDPQKVTIFGQSAGSDSIALLLTSPLATGLFQRAMGESGFGGGFYGPGDAQARRYIEAPHLDEAQQRGVELGKRTGAATLAELRSIPADARPGGKQVAPTHRTASRRGRPLSVCRRLHQSDLEAPGGASREGIRRKRGKWDAGADPEQSLLARCPSFFGILACR